MVPKYIVNGKYQCCRCKEWKSTSEFHKQFRAKNKLSGECKDCKKRRTDPYYVWAYNLKRWYDFTVEEYYGLLKKQKGKCGICGKEKLEGKMTKFCVDHCHSTKKVRGLLCSKCNLLLGIVDDDTNRLQKAIDYLRLKNNI